MKKTDKNRVIPFSPPDIGDEEIKEVIDALKSGWITTGPKTKELERKIAEYVGVEKAACLNSQSACAETVLRLLGLKEGDEVITSAYTYTASAEVVLHIHGVKLVLIDTQRNSISMDYDKLEKAINEHTKVIIPVDLGGIPCDYNRIFEIVESKKSLFQPSSELQEQIGRIVVLSDAAHALGASYHQKMIGSVADFSCFSFHAVKNFTTAEGGAIVWNNALGINNEEIYHKIQLLSLHGQSKDAFSKSKANAWEYDVVGTWYKWNMTDIHAAIGLGQISRYNEMLEKRKNLIEYYNERFKLDDRILFLEHYGEAYRSSGHLYLTRIKDISEKERNQIICKMAEKGVATNVHYKPLPMFTAYKNLGFDIIDYPNAYDFYHNEITLPLYSLLTLDDAEYVADCYLNAVNI